MLLVCAEAQKLETTLLTGGKERYAKRSEYIVCQAGGWVQGVNKTKLSSGNLQWNGAWGVTRRHKWTINALTILYDFGFQYLSWALQVSATISQPQTSQGQVLLPHICAGLEPPFVSLTLLEGLIRDIFLPVFLSHPTPLKLKVQEEKGNLMGSDQSRDKFCSKVHGKCTQKRYDLWLQGGEIESLEAK